MKSPQESFSLAIRLVGQRKLNEAVPLLDHALSDTQLRFAPLVRNYVRQVLEGRKTVEVVYENRRFLFGLGAMNLGLEMHHADGRFFEAAELSTIRALVPNRSVVVDVGANVGNHSIFFAALLSPALVIPVEPVSDAVSALRHNLELNHLVVDERGFGKAAGRRDEWLKVDLGTMRDLVEARMTPADEGSQTDLVRSVPLDALVPERVDFLKIDVEGFEPDVIAGAERILREDKPLLMVEAHDNKRALLLEQLASFNYKPIHSFEGIGYQNILLRVHPK